MKFIFNCVNDVTYSAELPDYNCLEDIVNDAASSSWITNAVDGVSIQVDKIISICEVKDEGNEQRAKNDET